jgi:hypothetical protein
LLLAKEILMRKVLGCGLALVLVCGVSGCGSSAAEQTMKDTIAAENELADIMEGIKDDASAEAAIPKMEKVGERMKEIVRKVKSLKMTKDEEKKLQEKYKPEMEKMQERLKNATMNLVKKAPGKSQKVMQAFMKVQTEMMKEAAP